jgi:alkylhydroperoxidase/carboxymuconolactone decarboxylase family protein YurZ
MFKLFIHRRIAALERAFGYDAAYLHEVADASTPAFVKFTGFQWMSSHRDQIPRDAWFAARIAAALSEDCGPCTQLVVNMALRNGMKPDAIASLLRGDLEQAGADAELGFRYGIAVANGTDDTLRLCEDAEARYGKRGLVSLAYAVACSRVYPALKRGLGHGMACSSIVVSDETVTIREAPRKAA